MHREEESLGEGIFRYGVLVANSGLTAATKKTLKCLSNQRSLRNRVQFKETMHVNYYRCFTRLNMPNSLNGRGYG